METKRIVNPKASFLKLFAVVLALLAIRAFAIADDNQSDFCYYNTVYKEIECMAFRKMSFEESANLPKEKKRIHADRLLIRAEKNLKKRKFFHSYIAKLVLEFDKINQEMAVMGEEYLRELRDLESNVITKGE